MAIKKEWNEPTKSNEKYKIDVMTIAPMNEIPRVKSVKWTKQTGKEEKGLENVISSEDLDLGITIAAENGGKDISNLRD